MSIINIILSSIYLYVCQKRINTTLYFDEGSGNDKTDISIQNYDFQDNYDVMIPMTFECNW